MTDSITFTLSSKRETPFTSISCSQSDGSQLDVTALFNKSGEYTTSDPAEITLLAALFDLEQKTASAKAAPKSNAKSEE